MNHPKPHDPVAMLRMAVGDLRIIGWLFSFLSILPLVIAVAIGARQSINQILAAVDSIILLGPGIWYLIAASSFKRRGFAVIRPTIWVAAGQVAVVLAILALAIVLQLRFLAALIIPAALVMFFVPAIGVTMWHLRRLERMSHLLLPMGMAFEPIRVQKIATTGPHDSEQASNGTAGQA